MEALKILEKYPNNKRIRNMTNIAHRNFAINLYLKQRNFTSSKYHILRALQFNPNDFKLILINLMSVNNVKKRSTDSQS